MISLKNLTLIIAFLYIPGCLTKCEKYFILLKENYDKSMEIITSNAVNWKNVTLDEDERLKEFNEDCVVDLACAGVAKDCTDIPFVNHSTGNDSRYDRVPVTKDIEHTTTDSPITTTVLAETTPPLTDPPIIDTTFFDNEDNITEHDLDINEGGNNETNATVESTTTNYDVVVLDSINNQTNGKNGKMQLANDKSDTPTATKTALIVTAAVAMLAATVLALFIAKNKIMDWILSDSYHL